jgi:aminopeptidase N
VEIELINTPTNTTIAASSIPTSQEENRYVYTSSNARNFVWSLSPSYVIETKEINGITISTHSFPFHQQAGSHVLKEATKAIELYSKLFSPYPRENLTIVEADFLDGMEYDGLFFLSRGFYNLFDFTPQNYLTAIAVHETAHQWWYASVANDQALEPWLDEALCTYSEILFYEEFYPELVDWWWEYRVNYYQPEGYVNLSIYEYQGFIPYRNATYLQGAKFLQLIRDELGDVIFFDFLKEYASSQKNRISSQTYFFEILQNYSDTDFYNSSTYFFK